MAKRSFTSRFRVDCAGTSAVEFALIAPVLLALMVAAADIAHIAFQRSDMTGAIRSGTQYFMAGGTHTDRAQAIVEEAWSSRPEEAVVRVERLCECGGVEASCNLLCADQSVPLAYAVITIEAPVGGVFVTQYSTVSDKVRVR
ncbi:MAG: TadE/TadG family type IV pilus assembly protein [Glycocaulis sp.]